MGELADYYLEQEELQMMHREFSNRHTRRPIWTDINGNKYYYWKDIDDNHLINIVKLLKRRNYQYIDKYIKELEKRNIAEGV